VVGAVTAVAQQQVAAAAALPTEVVVGVLRVGSCGRRWQRLGQSQRAAAREGREMRACRLDRQRRCGRSAAAAARARPRAVCRQRPGHVSGGLRGSMRRSGMPATAASAKASSPPKPQYATSRAVVCLRCGGSQLGSTAAGWTAMAGSCSIFLLFFMPVRAHHSRSHKRPDPSLNKSGIPLRDGAWLAGQTAIQPSLAATKPTPPLLWTPRCATSPVASRDARTPSGSPRPSRPFARIAHPRAGPRGEPNNIKI